ncbi:MAG: heme ABC exporter ATP-binding protein CcmA [Nitrospirae bacterium]|nr:MAG: heme ABC exporter ATP-binding protein CcmA [Nitrospirota bacterium]
MRQCSIRQDGEDRVSMPAIRVQDLSHSYGHYQVLRQVTLEISQGTCYTLLGANGSGKTTLLRILATLLRPTSGRIEILGRDGVTDKTLIRRSLLFLAHGSHLYEELNALENLQFALALRGLFPTPRQLKLVLDRVGIGAFASMKVRHYSAGMKKRLSFAKAMLAAPDILLLDEPFTALDHSGVELVQDYIREVLNRNGTILMSTHDPEKARVVSQQVGLLRQGTLHPWTWRQKDAS